MQTTNGCLNFEEKENVIFFFFMLAGQQKISCTQKGVKNQS